MREYVDFSVVLPHHCEIDARLHNWARWCSGHGRLGLQCPMFRLYRSTEVHRHETSVSGVIDGIDASRIQKAVIALPEKHRLAMGWCYIKRSSPAKAAASLGHSLHGLAELIHDGRQMLLNRGT